MKSLLSLLGVAACSLSLSVGCAAQSSPSASSGPLPPATSIVSVVCSGVWADALFDDPNVRYNSVAIITHIDGSEDYQHPAFEPHGAQTRATVSCEDGEIVSFLDFTPSK